MDFIVDTDEEYFDYSNWVFPQAQNLVQSRTITNGVVSQIHKLTAQDLAQGSFVSNGVVTISVTATHLNDVSIEGSVPAVNKVLTATSTTTADWL